MQPSSAPAPTSGGIYPRPLRACLLVRESHAPGEDNCSLKDQLERGMAFIQSQGWKIDPDKDAVVQVVSGWKKSPTGRRPQSWST